MGTLRFVDEFILIAYLAGTVGLGCWFMFRNRSAEDFTAAGGSMPGWVVGLSVFGTYLSSISFLALPGKAFIADWSPFAFSLSIPLAAWIAVRFFVPFYRGQCDVSAYRHLESRFGLWARVYAVGCYLLTQVARMGSVMYLLALPLHQLLGWGIPEIIIITGVLTTIYSCIGGIRGVIWTDAVQSLVLIGGALTCAVALPLLMPDGPAQMFRLAAQHRKFSLGGFGPSVGKATFWVVLVYGIFINLQNFGIDQNYVQRYHTARSRKEANRAVWLGGLLYVPVSMMFFFIGTGLFTFYTARPDLLPAAIRAEAAAGKGDSVFPYFIVKVLPTGMTGLLIAAIFAAAMSTLSSSLNSAATLTLSDLYKRFFRPQAAGREALLVLYAGTLGWGLVGTGAALAMIRVRSALDAWWELAGIFSGGMLGLFLLGLISRRAGSPAAAVAVVAGLVVIVWMSLSPRLAADGPMAALRSPFHGFMVIVVGTLTLFLVGLLLSRWLPGPGRPPEGPGVVMNEEARS